MADLENMVREMVTDAQHGNAPQRELLRQKHDCRVQRLPPEVKAQLGVLFGKNPPVGQGEGKGREMSKAASANANALDHPPLPECPEFFRLRPLRRPVGCHRAVLSLGHILSASPAAVSRRYLAGVGHGGKSAIGSAPMPKGGGKKIESCTGSSAERTAAAITLGVRATPHERNGRLRRSGTGWLTSAR